MKHSQFDIMKALMADKSIESIYLDTAQMKILFKVEDRTLYRWRKKKLVFSRKIGGKHFYPLHMVMNMMEAPPSP
ncbi:hypothetical protein ACI6PS_12035 [Flavobacterium sp. PLA-1-15]|uniref:hypothetical protein n=1 Tax=Flavobacterium sp. PLA-1-15 TaxID=3380533 RepID=UPI003B7ACDA2